MPTKMLSQKSLQMISSAELMPTWLAAAPCSRVVSSSVWLSFDSVGESKDCRTGHVHAVNVDGSGKVVTDYECQWQHYAAVPVGAASKQTKRAEQSR